MFKVGDRVRCVGGRWYGNIGKDNIGIIVKILDSSVRDNLAVDWDKKPQNRYGDVVGHDCSGATRSGYGYYVSEKNCISAKKSNIERYSE